MSTSKFMAAINAICDEKNLEVEDVLEGVKAALAAAYKKDYGTREQEVRAEINEETGEVVIFVAKTVVENVEDEALEISKEDAKKINEKAKVGETVELKEVGKDFGRIAAQTAKQVIIQRIREAERNVMFKEYKDKEGTLINGQVQRIEGRNVYIDLGKATAIMYPQEQIFGERYFPGQRIKILIVSVGMGMRGPEIQVTRSSAEFIRALFELEVPELSSEVVKIESIAREAGGRTKIAVSTTQEAVDPIGSFVGQRGSRVQAVQNELGEEKIDIISFEKDEKKYITNALSPAKVKEVKVTSKKNMEAKVVVPENQLSLAIGKSGQNVRLAVKLTGWKIDIEGSTDNTDATNENTDDTDENEGKTNNKSTDKKKEDKKSVKSDSESMVEKPTDEVKEEVVENESEESVIEKSVESAIEESAESVGEEVGEEKIESVQEESIEELAEQELEAEEKQEKEEEEEGIGEEIESKEENES